jgi:hypothetical protein
MPRHTLTLARALALCVMFAGTATVTRAQPLSSVKPQASPVIILAQQEEPGVPRGAKCLAWAPARPEARHFKMKCTRWCYPNPDNHC